MSVIEADFGMASESGPFSDHRLPLVLLRERRRELVMEMRSRGPSISNDLIREIAAIQQTIKAVEAVIAE
ncbi:MAG: hypothetical protein V4661_02430 [Pseudomonadota bacterium]|jgi:hypothetical protein